MTILFIRPAQIDITPAFERILCTSALKSRDDSLKILHWASKTYHNLELSDQVKFEKKRSLFAYISWTILIFKTLLKEKPTHIHTFSFLNWFGVFIYKIFYPKTRIFYDCRDYFAWSKKYSKPIENSIRYLDIIFSKMADLIIFPDKTGFKYFKSHNSKFKVIPNTVEDVYDEIFQTTDDITNDNKIKLCFVGYTSIDRNISAIVEACRHFNHIELHIASSYISKNVADTLDQTRNIIYHGKLERKECMRLIKNCDYCLITYNPDLINYQYIQPTKFYDCLMLNKPYICSNGMHELGKYTSNEWPNISVEYDNANAFKKIKKPVKNELNRKLYENKFKYEEIIKNLDSLYDQFLKTPHHEN